MTDAEFQAWLQKDGARRVVLVEVLLDTPKYLSNVGYTTLPTDTPANRYYQAVLTDSIAFSERMNLSGDGSVNISAGDIDINNSDGAYDSWLNEVWVNRSIRVLLGDLSWTYSDFKLIFDGVVADLKAPERSTLAISLRNKLERLNTPVTETLLGGTTSNKDRLMPVGFGECHNVTPILENEGLSRFKLSGVRLERIIEARSNGAPITITQDLLNGQFRMTTAMYGTITASVQFGYPYTNRIAGIIQELVTNWGTPSERFTVSDLDTAQIAAFDAAHPQGVGIWLPDRANVLVVCQQLAASVGAQVTMTGPGKMRLVKLDLTALTPTATINPWDYVERSFAISERTEVIAGVNLGYCKNWTVQEALETGIPQLHVEMYAREWYNSKVRDAGVAANYRLYGEPEQVDSLLLATADADAESARRLAMWKVPRTVYSFEGLVSTLTLELGQHVTIVGDRYGMQAGKNGQIVGIERDWLLGRTHIEVLV